jgi:hypothetical protein
MIKGKLFCLIVFAVMSKPVIAQSPFNPENKPSYTDRRTATENFSMVNLRCGNDLLRDCVGQHLAVTISELYDSRCRLVLQSEIESPAGHHLTYIQLFNNVPVYGAGLKVNLDKNSNIISSFNYLFDVSDWENLTYPDHSMATLFISQHMPGCRVDEINHIVFFDGSKPMPALKLKVFVPQRQTHYEMLIDDGASLVYQKDLSLYAAPPDSIVRVKVFNPDPLTTAQQSYKSPYVDSSDVDVPQLNAERQTKNIRVKFQNDTFFLTNAFVDIQELADPVLPVPYSISDSFDYTRSQEEFEAVNAFYHITLAQEHIQALGFTNLVNFPLPVDAHGFGGVDNSVFKYDPGPPRLLFGDGGVDDAEDADVIIHEYHHAVSFSAAPFTAQGHERMAIEEGLSDYMAASYSRFLNPFNWQKVYNWDGNFGFQGRSCDSPKKYPIDPLASLYQNSEIWSTVLMKIWEDLGRDKTDQLLLNSMYSYFMNMSMPQAARLILQSDSLLNGGVNYHTLYYRFVERGILDWNVGMPSTVVAEELRISGTYEFATGNGHAAIQISPGYSGGSLQLCDELGRIVREDQTGSGDHIEISPEGLKPGIYIATIRSGKAPVSFKLVKF